MDQEGGNLKEESWQAVFPVDFFFLFLIAEDILVAIESA